MLRLSERLVLQALRSDGPLPQATLARSLHLKPQTLSLIVSRLEKDGLLLRLPSVRGRVGQPSVPIALNPDGAFAIGIKVGRRNIDALLIDFVGTVRERRLLEYSFPDPRTVFSDIDMLVDGLRGSLNRSQRSRLSGIGVAAPFSLHGWQDLLGVEPKLVKAWQHIDLRQRVAALKNCSHLRVEFVKDTSAACLAELVQGHGGQLRSFLYVFVDTFVGGGLVLNGHLYGGRSGNAGAVGSIPLNTSRGGGSPAQLLDVASLWSLDTAYQKAGVGTGVWADARALSSPWRGITNSWMKQSARAIALSINDAACLLDLDGAIVDGSFSGEILKLLVDAIGEAMNEYNWEGVRRPPILPGKIGADAQALGGALLPLYAKFSPESTGFTPKRAAT